MEDKPFPALPQANYQHALRLRSCSVNMKTVIKNTGKHILQSSRTCINEEAVTAWFLNASGFISRLLTSLVQGEVTQPWTRLLHFSVVSLRSLLIDGLASGSLKRSGEIPQLRKLFSLDTENHSYLGAWRRCFQRNLLTHPAAQQASMSLIHSSRPT